MPDDKIFESVLDGLKSRKIDGYEIYIEERKHFLASSKEEKIENVEKASEIGVAVRVISGGGLGFSYTTSIDKDEIERCIEAAIESSVNVDADSSAVIPPTGGMDDLDWKYYDGAFATLTAGERAGFAIELESAARDVDKRITGVRKAVYSELEKNIRIINSNGADFAYKKTVAESEIVAIAKDGDDSQWIWDGGFSFTVEGLGPKAVGKRAAERALSLLGGRAIKTMKTPACIDPFVATQLIKILANGFFGNNIYKKKSNLAGKLGKKIYSENLNLVNDSRMKNGYGSAPFDDEGGRTEKVHLIKEGHVESWLLDSFWGKKLGMKSTGSSVRPSLRELPDIGVSNLYIERGELSREELFKKMDTGFHITGILGGHTINAITGDFSVGAEGVWIEGGSKKHTIHGVAIAGNLHELFAKVVDIGSDLFFTGEAGSPTLLISEIQVSGV